MFELRILHPMEPTSVKRINDVGNVVINRYVRDVNRGVRQELLELWRQFCLTPVLICDQLRRLEDKGAVIFHILDDCYLNNVTIRLQKAAVDFLGLDCVKVPHFLSRFLILPILCDFPLIDLANANLFGGKTIPLECAAVMIVRVP